MVTNNEIQKMFEEIQTEQKFLLGYINERTLSFWSRILRKIKAGIAYIREQVPLAIEYLKQKIRGLRNKVDDEE